MHISYNCFSAQNSIAKDKNEYGKKVYIYIYIYVWWLFGWLVGWWLWFYVVSTFGGLFDTKINISLQLYRQKN